MGPLAGYKAMLIQNIFLYDKKMSSTLVQDWIKLLRLNFTQCPWKFNNVEQIKLIVFF